LKLEIGNLAFMLLFRLSQISNFKFQAERLTIP
jgi:hypothetical protein